MNDPQKSAERLVRIFEQIQHEQMRDLPILNNRVHVQSLGFQRYQGRVVGVVITPWLMCLVILPGADEEWSGLELGKKQSHKFPSGTFQFTVNEIDGIGRYQSHSLFSPMHEFANHDHALAAAQSFLDTLMVEREATGERPVDEALPEKIMDGKAWPKSHLDQFATIEVAEVGGPVTGRSESATQTAGKLSRRDLLRGNFPGRG